MTATSFTFQSSDGTEIFAMKWSSEDPQKPRAAVQIAHGYAEHIGRYDAFAHRLAEAGIVVYGNDHRGHGKTNRNASEAICFSDEAGFDKVVADMRALTEIIQAENPDIPLFLFGHSMGSMLTRRYIQLYGDDLAGAILSGSGVFSNALLKLGTVVAASEIKGKGRAHPSRLLDKLVFQNFNRGFKPARTDLDWLSRDGAEVDRFLADPLRGKIGSAGYFHDFFSGLLAMNDSANIRSIPKDLPLHFISGTADPVGGRVGKGIIQTCRVYQHVGLQDVSYKLYEGARHELLNETNKDEVAQDIIEWIFARLESL
ncbi:alpha/beta hydrolase [Trichococcus pasteurii]|uniref:Alpha/beta hydrolase fold n=1 Tax=Trichococcus pasteurii TaxID=43064 RepID=A0A1W1IF40_9LACT|nr:alpha/beta hydrolase [Trichococcus pasteurii]SFE44515.1 Lysophospholipase, alpha-beta hydrolase superfamily [Trichococcus pasteurii]SLM51637.1 alpha/beta hydrolase fold [Trichococcus pasteurii]SSB92518.1 alpha/beta hydrolase fold [Trichococcus pasteurii]